MIEIKQLTDLVSLEQSMPHSLMIEHIKQRFQQAYPQGRDNNDGYFVLVENTDHLENLAMRYQLHFNEANHEFVDHHQGFYEVLFLLGDDGFGIDLLIPDTDTMDMKLIEYCQSHSKLNQDVNHSS